MSLEAKISTTRTLSNQGVERLAITFLNLVYLHLKKWKVTIKNIKIFGALKILFLSHKIFFLDRKIRTRSFAWIFFF